MFLFSYFRISHPKVTMTNICCIISLTHSTSWRTILYRIEIQLAQMLSQLISYSFFHILKRLNVYTKRSGLFIFSNCNINTKSQMKCGCQINWQGVVLIWRFVHTEIHVRIVSSDVYSSNRQIFDESGVVNQLNVQRDSN